MLMFDPIPPQVRDLFRSHPEIHTVVWDGEVSGNGSLTGEASVFEPLWDLLVDTPHARFVRTAEGAVNHADILLPL